MFATLSIDEADVSSGRQGRSIGNLDDTFGAAHIVGYFDSIEDMQKVYDRHKGHTALSADANGWRLVK